MNSENITPCDPHRPISQPLPAGPVQNAKRRRSILDKVWLVTEVFLARMRFVALMVAVGAVIVNWGYLKALYEKWTRPLADHVEASSNTEFWCPMHPTVVRDHPDKCPICGMPLSQRKKGETGKNEPLPPGVITRVQLSPYRVALAGIKTEPVQYRSLSRDIRTVGFVEFDEQKLKRITVKIGGKSRIDKLYVNVTGQDVEKGDPLALLYSPELMVTVQNLTDAKKTGNMDLLKLARERLQLWGIHEDQISQFLHTTGGVTHFVVRSPAHGHVLQKYRLEGDYVEEGTVLYDVADLSTVWIEAEVYEEEVGLLQTSLAVEATASAFPGKTFTGKLAFVFPHLDTSTRTLKVRFNMDNPGHVLKPGMYTNVSLQVPVTRLQGFSEHFQEMAAATTSLELLKQSWAAPGALFSPDPAPLLATGLGSFALKQGLALAVPETAVIDTGSRKVVYREREPGVYEGVEVVLGPVCDNYYPVIAGLSEGERLAVAGAFLIDAETRLTTGLGSTYFGASGTAQGEGKSSSKISPSMSEDEDEKIQANLAKLSAKDREQAETQKRCPIRKAPLGSMGTPVKILIKGQPVFLCCSGCRDQAFQNPSKTLETAEKFKTATHGDHGSPDVEEKALIRKYLDKLPPQDRKLAETQKFCVIHKKNLLGSMGVPHKVMIQGQPVFLCCEGCEDDAAANPGQTLKDLKKLRQKAGGGQ